MFNSYLFLSSAIRNGVIFIRETTLGGIGSLFIYFPIDKNFLISLSYLTF